MSEEQNPIRLDYLLEVYTDRYCNEWSSPSKRDSDNSFKEFQNFLYEIVMDQNIQSFVNDNPDIQPEELFFKLKELGK